MTTRAYAEKAFPHPGDESEHASPGMSLRDWFAGQALAGILTGYWSNPEMSGITPRALAEEAYQNADAMLAARGADQ